MLGIPPLPEVVSEMVDAKQPLMYLDALDVSLNSRGRFEEIKAPVVSVSSALAGMESSCVQYQSWSLRSGSDDLLVISTCSTM